MTALNYHGQRFGLDQAHWLAHFPSQLAHESDGFFYYREIASGAAYEGREDLGNSKAGDGKRFKGRSPIQITGRANYGAFTKWARKFDASAPDFEARPDLQARAESRSGRLPFQARLTEALSLGR